MKKFLVASAAALMVAGSAMAGEPLAPIKPFDNYSITLKGGVVSPWKQYGGKSFWTNMRGVAGIEIRKQIAPAFGLGVEGEWMFNTSTWNRGSSLKNIVDHQYIGAFGAVNFNNLFAGYAGQPRIFEIEGVLGAGWLHGYRPATQAKDYNDFATKAGLNLNFNLGSSKAWTVALKPAVIWNMTGNWRTGEKIDACYSTKTAVVELEAGVTYHFGCSNGTHSFAFAGCDYSAYNDQINALRAENAALAAANADCLAASAVLAAQLDECRNRPAPAPVTNTVVKNTNSLESVRYVFYKIGSSTITADQQPNVVMIADYMKNNPKSTIVIKGYASKDGNLEFNQKLAAKRAESVKNMLVNKYGIKADRIKAEGEGIGEMFKEESWNRVAICILNEDN